MSEQTTSFSFDGFAIIEFMGHRRRAGKVRTAEIGGNAVFIVESSSSSAEGGKMTEVYAASALYAMTPVSEEVATMAARSINPAPLSEYDLPAEWRTAVTKMKSEQRECARAIAAETVTITLRPEQAALLNGAVYTVAQPGDIDTPALQEISEVIESAIQAKNRELERQRPRGYVSTYGPERDDEDGPF